MKNEVIPVVLIKVSVNAISSDSVVSIPTFTSGDCIILSIVKMPLVSLFVARILCSVPIPVDVIINGSGLNFSAFSAVSVSLILLSLTLIT